MFHVQYMTLRKKVGYCMRAMYEFEKFVQKEKSKSKAVKGRQVSFLSIILTFNHT